MNWRWHKIVRFGPINTTLSKKGIGWSIGIPGLRYGISPIGRRYISVSIPGTGLYGIKYLNAVTPPAISASSANSPKPLLPPQSQKWWKQKNFPRD